MLLYNPLSIDHGLSNDVANSALIIPGTRNF